jgi:hypothetical protein
MWSLATEAQSVAAFEAMNLGEMVKRKDVYLEGSTTLGQYVVAHYENLSLFARLKLTGNRLGI